MQRKKGSKHALTYGQKNHVIRVRVLPGDQSPGLVTDGSDSRQLLSSSDP